VATFQAGVSGPAGSASVDTNVRLSALTTNYGSDTELYIGVTNGPTKVYRSLLAFQLAGVPAGAVITDCRLTLNIIQRTNPTAGRVRRLCAEHWLDGDGQGEAQATWSSWRTGQPWGSAGAGSTAACAAGGDYATADEVAYTPRRLPVRVRSLSRTWRPSARTRWRPGAGGCACGSPKTRKACRAT
jgi:hypothetical protein